MGLKLLHAADLHLDSPFASLPEAVREQMKAAQQSIPRRLADLCLAEQCDIVLLAGDAFDCKATWESIGSLKRELARCDVPVFITPGNHDFCQPGSPWLEDSWPENVYIFTGGLEAVDLPQCRVYGAGYQSMDCPPLLEDFRIVGEKAYHIGILHGDPVNAASPCCPVTAAQVRQSGLDYLALGHLHRAGGFRAGKTYCAWPGCVMGRGWDETGEKGVYIVTLDDSVTITPVNLGLPSFYDWKADITSGAEEALDALLPPVESPNCYRITLTGEGNPDCEALAGRYAHLALLEIRDESQPPMDLWDCVDEDSLRGVFFRMLKEQLGDANEDQQRLIRLAARLSRQLMDGKEVELP